MRDGTHLTKYVLLVLDQAVPDTEEGTAAFAMDDDDAIRVSLDGGSTETYVAQVFTFDGDEEVVIKAMVEDAK